jgi:uncharacterized membrane protein
MPDPPRSVRLTESTRVESFSDAVLAIVLTLLVLELRMPGHAPGRLSATVAQMWASIVAFLISFLRVSVFWVNHHDTFARIRRVDRRLVWMNLWLLLNCTIVPIPTAILADALRAGDPADLRWATALYVLLAGVWVAAWIPMLAHLQGHPELVEPGTDAAYFHARRIRSWLGTIADAAAVAVALVAPVPALALWTLTLILLAATSDRVPAVPILARRRTHASRQERST